MLVFVVVCVARFFLSVFVFGWQVFTIGAHTFQDALSQSAESYDHEFNCRYICEIDESKWKWEQEVLKVHSPQACHFKDCAKLFKLECKCHTHSQQCVVPETEGIVAGISCKDFSKQNPNKWLRAKGSLLENDKSPGKSCETFWGTVKLIDANGCQWCILENSDELLENDQGDWKKILVVMNSRGFRCISCVCCSTEFALPQRRRRSYLVCIAQHSKVFFIKEWSLTRETFMRHLNRMRRIPPSFEQILLADDHPFIRAMFEIWSKHAPAGLEASTVDKHMAHSRSKRSCLDCSYGRLQVRESTAMSPWFPPLNYRMRDVLASEQADDGPKSSHTVHDLSQTIGRCPVSTVHPEFPHVALMPTVLPGSFFWLSKTPTPDFPDTRPDIKYDRPLCPEEHMMLQAWPSTGGPLTVSDHRSVANSMAGNAFTGTLSMAVFMSLISSLQWLPAIESDDVIDEDDVTHTFDALAALVDG